MKLIVENNTVTGYLLEEKPIKDKDKYSSSTAMCKENKIELIINEGVEIIGKEAFRGCSELKSITFPKSLKAIEAHAFENCTCLETAVIPDCTESIGTAAFKGCTSLKNIRLPKALREVSASMLKDCAMIDSVTLYEGCRAIGSAAFEKTSVKSVAVPSTVKSIGSRAFNDTPLEEITFSEGLETIGEYAFAKAKLTELELPEGVKKIGAFWLSGTCETLRHVYLPDSLVDIAPDALCNASWESRKFCALEVNSETSPVIQIVQRIKDAQNDVYSKYHASGNVGGIVVKVRAKK